MTVTATENRLRQKKNIEMRSHGCNKYLKLWETSWNGIMGRSWMGRLEEPCVAMNGALKENLRKVQKTKAKRNQSNQTTDRNMDVRDFLMRESEGNEGTRNSSPPLKLTNKELMELCLCSRSS